MLMLPCVEILNSLVPIRHSPDLDQGLLQHEINDAKQVHHREDGEEEEEGRGLDVTLSEDEKYQDVAEDTQCSNSGNEESLHDCLNQPGVNAVAGSGILNFRHILGSHSKAFSRRLIHLPV